MRYFLILFLLCFLFSCAQKRVVFVQKDQASQLGVVPFLGEGFSDEILHKLDKILNRELLKRGWQGYKKAAVIRQCEEIVLSEKKGYLKGLEKWIEVGKCVPVRFLLVPQIKVWRERIGSKWGVSEPAKVEFYLYLIDIKEKKNLVSFHFNKEQRPLSEDLLNIKRLFRGKGWITAEDLFVEGITQGLKEMGL